MFVRSSITGWDSISCDSPLKSVNDKRRNHYGITSSYGHLVRFCTTFLLISITHCTLDTMRTAIGLCLDLHVSPKSTVCIKLCKDTYWSVIVDNSLYCNQVNNFAKYIWLKSDPHHCCTRHNVCRNSLVPRNNELWILICQCTHGSLSSVCNASYRWRRLICRYILWASA